MQTKQKKMNLVATVLALAGLMVFSVLVVAGNLEPAAPPAPTMKTLDEVEPRIPISEDDMPLTISASGSYYLTENINAKDTAITVEANDVTIDLMGHSLIGPGTGSNFGVYMEGRSNVEIRNGTVRGFGSHGIYEGSLDDGRGHRVIRVRVMSNGARGIYLRGSGNLVQGCTFAGNASGGIDVGHGSTVAGNTVCENGYDGIRTSTASTVSGNASYGNGQDGIQTDDGCTLTGNTVYQNQNSGIYATVGCTITGNTVNANNQSNTAQDAGIRVSWSCMVKANTAKANMQNNIYVYAERSAIEENLLIDSTNGIYFRTDGNFYANNRAAHNTTNYNDVPGNYNGGGNVGF
jgi:parallel beta-helix repeat protein